MGTKLFVGSLAWTTDDARLRTAFEPHGEVVDAVVITDRETGRSRGFGFVTMADDGQAKAAVAAMDGASLDGRTIRVNEAQERAPRPGGPRPGGPSRGGPGGGPGRGPQVDRRGPPRPRTGRDDDRGERGGGGYGGGGGGDRWGSAPAAAEGDGGWGDDAGSRRSKRSRKFEGQTKGRERRGDEDRDGFRDRGGAGGRSRRRSWDDWDDE